jgi:hypothetical protein
MVGSMGGMMACILPSQYESGREAASLEDVTTLSVDTAG